MTLKRHAAGEYQLLPKQGKGQAGWLEHESGSLANTFQQNEAVQKTIGIKASSERQKMAGPSCLTEEMPIDDRWPWQHAPHPQQ